ncbi:MAG TPA: aminotransferase class III-fold pyridoxal phosphate-dependent enzyme, partial [Terrimicrobiaceae bacterium]|nr:aminotransferase class III-fold pyridoxal phosphate-dependent enzyme [Terrimicrobiaceae bacterium]
AIASITEHLQEETGRRARRAGRTLRQALWALDSSWIGNIRGVGAMVGLELVKGDGSPHGALAGEIMRRGLQDGLILLGGGASGGVLSFAPPFRISDAEVEFLAAKLADYLAFLPGSIW